MTESQARYPGVKRNYQTGKFIFGGPDKNLLALIGDVQDKTVLDFASGDGPYTADLVRQGAFVIAADYDEKALATLKTNVLKEKLDKVQPIKINAFKQFPLKDGSMDKVVTTRFPNLFSQEEITHLMTESARVLKDEGTIIFDFATHIKRIGPDGKRIKGQEEVGYNIISGYRTIIKTLKDSGFRKPKVTLTRVNQDLQETAGYTMKAWKLNVRATKQ